MSNWTFPRLALEPVTLRLFEEADLGSAQGIIRAIGTERLGQDLRSWDQVYHSTDGVIWTALYGDAVVGFGGISIYQEISFLHSDIVHPDAQGLGIGTALVLVRLATTDFTEQGRVGLAATEYSYSFYQRFGFEPVSEGNTDPSSSFQLFPMERTFSEQDGYEAWRVLEVAGATIALDLP